MFNHHNEYVLKNKEVLSVRQVKVSDAEALVHHMKVVDQETEFLAREPGEFNLSVEQEEKFIESALSNENIGFLVAEINGEIVANCSVGYVMRYNKYKHRAAMGLAIKKAHWRKGIGKILMEECAQWCKERNIEQLELDVVTENERGIGLYKSMGFEVFGTKKHALKFKDGRYADEYYMILFLNKVE